MKYSACSNACFWASLSRQIYNFDTLCSIIFLRRSSDIVLPNNGIAFRLTAIASNAPSTNTIGSDQLINNSNPTQFLEVSGFLCLKDSAS